MSINELTVEEISDVSGGIFIPIPVWTSGCSYFCWPYMGWTF